MYWMKIQSRQENVIYLALWGMLFAAPVLMMYLRTVNNTYLSFNWLEIFFVWKLFAFYLVIFLIHNFLLAPLLIYRRKRMLYVSMIAAILALFVAYQCSQRPKFMERRPIPMERKMDDKHDQRERGPQPYMMGPHRDRPPREFHQGEHHGEPRGEHRGERRLPAFIGVHNIVAVVSIILMFGMNIGIKLFFKNRTDQKKLDDLQKKNLEQQLEYLKYQINPHFFMNTLNNIHALVDIDPEQAKASIEEFSKLMRHVLYEGDRPTIPLAKEMEFLRHYVSLMRLRYADTVRIDLSLPEKDEGAEIPPLVLASFVENAFKHGISYEKPSFVRVTVSVEDGKIVFRCANSQQDSVQKEQHGVGLANVRGRLELLYGDRYTLSIDQCGEVYDVVLILPAMVNPEREGT